MQAFTRDDMVLRPRVHGRMSKTRERAQLEHNMERTARKGHRLGRMMRLRAKQKALGVGRRLAGGAVRGLRAAQATEALGTVRTVASRSAVLNPVGLAVAAIAVGGLVATRLVTGRSFENMGETLKTTLLGDKPAEALASRQAREVLEGNDDVLLMAGDPATRASVLDQAAKVHRVLSGVYQVAEDGKQAIRGDPEFQVNNTLDMLILRVADAMKRSWEDGGPALVKELSWKLGCCIAGYTIPIIGIIRRFAQ